MRGCGGTRNALLWGMPPWPVAESYPGVQIATGILLTLLFGTILGAIAVIVRSLIRREVPL